MSFEYYPHIPPLARDGLVILKRYHQVIYTLETRVGKTYTALLTAKLYGAKNVLFLGTVKSCKHTREDLGNVDYPFEATVINYESLHKVNGNFDLVILDECHKIGAYPKPSNRTKTVKRYCKGLPIIYLSATPTPETFSQLFHQQWVCSWGVWSQYSNFYKWVRGGYVKVYQIRITSYSANQYDRADEKRILNDIAHLQVSCTQSDSGFKQNIIEKIHYVKMKPLLDTIIIALRTKKLYRANNAIIVADTTASLRAKHHQLSSGTVITDDGTSYVLDKSKAIYIRDTFKGALAIFYQFKNEEKMLKHVFPNCTSDSIEFQAGKSDVFISQFQSGREGTNVSRADNLVFLNIAFSFLSYEQTKNRFQNKDREKPAYLHFIFNDSPLALGPGILKVVKGKKKFTSVHYKKLKFDKPKPLTLF